MLGKKGKTAQRSPYLLAAAMLAVAQPVVAQQWNGTTRDSAGVTIVANTNQGMWAGTNQWRIEPTDVLIGSADGDPDYEFGQIVGIAVSADGRIFVFDQQAQQIKVFDNDGYFLSAIGGPGGGPGEFGPQAGPILMGRGDTLFVPDITNRRVNAFTAEGNGVGSFVMDIANGIPINWAVTTDGYLVSHMRPLGAGTSPGDTLDVVALRAVDGSVIDTLLQVSSGRTFVLNPGALPEWNFFTPEPAWSLGDGRNFYAGVSDDYRIGFHDNDGNLVRLITKPFEAEPVTDRDQRIFNEFFEELLLEQPGVTPDIIPVLMNGVHFNDTYPAFLQFRSGPAGTLWVQHIQLISALTDEEAENFNPLLSLGGADWDVFDPEGRLLGEIQMPSRFQPVQFVGTDIYGIWRDEFDVQYVLKVAVVGVPGGDS